MTKSPIGPHPTQLTNLRTCSVVAFGALSMITLMLAGCGSSSHAADKKEIEIPLLRVPVIVAQTSQVERTTTQPATLHAFHDARIFGKASGYVSALNVDLGDAVKAGDILATIEVPEVASRVASEKAELVRLQAMQQQAEARIGAAEAGVVSAKANHSQSVAQEQATLAQLQAVRIEFDRAKQLVAERAVASRVLDEATERLKAAEASYAAAKAGTASAAAQVGTSEAELLFAKASLATAAAEVAVGQSQIEHWQTLLSFATLRSPFDGVVVERNVELGDLVTNSQTGSPVRPLLVVAMIQKIRVRVSVPERESPWVDVGDVAKIKLPALSGQVFEGKVSRLSGSLDQATRTRLVEIDLDNAQGKLLPGMFGEATIVMQSDANRVTLPATAVRFDGKGKSFVHRLDDQQVVKTLDVTIGQDDGLVLEIVTGLSGGERIVDATVHRIKDGQKVQPL